MVLVALLLRMVACFALVRRMASFGDVALLLVMVLLVPEISMAAFPLLVAVLSVMVLWLEVV